MCVCVRACVRVSVCVLACVHEGDGGGGGCQSRKSVLQV